MIGAISCQQDGFLKLCVSGTSILFVGPHSNRLLDELNEVLTARHAVSDQVKVRQAPSWLERLNAQCIAPCHSTSAHPVCRTGNGKVAHIHQLPATGHTGQLQRPDGGGASITCHQHFIAVRRHREVVATFISPWSSGRPLPWPCDRPSDRPPPWPSGRWLMSIRVFVSTEESLVHRIFTLGVRIFPIPEDGARAVGG